LNSKENEDITSGSQVCSVGGGLRWLDLDAAHAVTVNDGDTDVALFTPGGSPRVLNLVVRGAIGVSAEADSEDAVVKIGATVGGDDAASVPLEDLLVGLDGDRDGALGDGGLESLGARRGHVHVAGHADLALGLVGVAR